MKVAFITAPAGEAHGLARRAVEAKLAACVNVIPGITSHYRWQEELHADSESLLVAKVPEDRVEDFVSRIRDWHTYTCPEVVLLDVIGGNADYISWVENVGQGSSQKT